MSRWLSGIAVVLLALFLGGIDATPASAQAAAGPPPPLALVMVDMQQLIYGSKAAKGIQSQMEQHRQAFSKEVAQQEDQLQKARGDLERQRSVTPPNQLEAKGREYQQKVEALDRNVQGKQQALQQVYNEAMSKVESAALQVVAEVAAAHQANIVVQKAAVIFSKDGFDITAEAMQKLDERLPAVSVNQPKPVDVSKAKPATPAPVQSQSRQPPQIQPPPQAAPSPQLNLQLQPGFQDQPPPKN